MENSLTDLEKQQLLTALFLNKVYAPGLDRLALRVVQSISGVREREAALLMLSHYLAAFGNFELADEVARRRLRGHASASGLATIGCEVAKKDPARAIRYLRDAEELMREITDPDEKAILLQLISRGYSRANKWEQSKELANQISPTEDRVSTLCEIAGSLWRASEVEAAKRTLAEAHALANQTQLSERTGALNDVAKVLAQMNETKEATEVWEVAIAFAHHSMEPSKWLFSICEKLVSIGNRHRAREVALLIKNDARRKEALSVVGET